MGYAFLTLVVSTLTAPLAVGCSSKTCTTEADAGLVIWVRDARTTAAICDATVEVIDGNYREALAHFPTACDYFGAYERTGTYRVEVQRTGYLPAIVDGVQVHMNDGSCHVATTPVTVDLDPDPNAPRDAGSE